MPIRLVGAKGASFLFTSAVFPVGFKEPKSSPPSSNTFPSDCSLPYRNAPEGSSYRMIFMFGGGQYSIPNRRCNRLWQQNEQLNQYAIGCAPTAAAKNTF